MDHGVLLAMLERHVPDGRVLDLLRQYVRRTIYDGGLYEDVERGISLGCPLSPLMGALYLKLLDERVEATGLTYARFMDDWVILAPTRWKLREAIRLVNQTLTPVANSSAFLPGSYGKIKGRGSRTRPLHRTAFASSLPAPAPTRSPPAPCGAAPAPARRLTV